MQTDLVDAVEACAHERGQLCTPPERDGHVSHYDVGDPPMFAVRHDGRTYEVDVVATALALLLDDPCPDCVARGGRWEWARQTTALEAGQALATEEYMRREGWLSDTVDLDRLDYEQPPRVRARAREDAGPKATDRIPGRASWAGIVRTARETKRPRSGLAGREVARCRGEPLWCISGALRPIVVHRGALRGSACHELRP